jgi:hypothetical protein
MTSRIASLARCVRCLIFARFIVFVAVALTAIDSARAIDFAVGPKEVIYTTKQRKQRKVSTWPDGNLGVVATGNGGYEFYAANGPKPVKTTGTLTDPAQTTKSVTISNLPKKTFDYVSGGPVYQDAATGARLMVYHAEKHGSSAKDFHSVLGLAVSTDASGLVFRDLGTIIEPNLQYGVAEVGGGTFAVVDNHLHVYYRDWLSDGTTRELAVARAPLSDLIHNALGGQGTQFSKYYNGSWSQPGRGGLASALEIGNPGSSWISVSQNDYLDQLVMVTSAWEAGGGDLYLSTSPDGINWSARQPLALEAGEQFYPSLIGTGADPTHTGKSFYVYYTDSQRGAWDRWKDAQLVRREITIDPWSAPPPPISPSDPPADSPSVPGNWAQVAGYQSDFQPGGAPEGWTYAWNPTGKLGDSRAFTPLVWSDVAQSYNTTGGATTVPGRKKKKNKSHPDDHLLLNASGGHPGQPTHMPIVGYTIQDEDGEGLYRIAGSSIAKLDGTASPGEDGLEVLVYVNNALSGPAQHVATNGLTASFDRELGALGVGDTVWVAINALNNQSYDSFINFDFVLQKEIPSFLLMSSSLELPDSETVVPEPCTLHMVFVAIAGWQIARGRRRMRSRRPAKCR